MQDVRLRFRRSFLGPVWIFLNLAIMIGAVGVVYGTLLGQDLAKFLPFLTVSLVAWNYLTASVLEGGNAFVASEGYIKQIGLPLYVYVFRFFVSVSFSLFLSLLAYLVVAFLYEIPFHWRMVWAIPGLLLLMIVSFLLIAIFAHLNARFRDVTHVAALGLQVLFYVTPILWTPEMLRNRGLPWLIDWNPFYHILEIVRQPLLQAKPAAVVNYQATGLFIVCLLLLSALVTKRYYRRLVYFL